MENCTSFNTIEQKEISKRFRGFLPVVVDVETAGLNPKRSALLEIAMVFLSITKTLNEQIEWNSSQVLNRYIVPFLHSDIDQNSLELTGINLDHPFRKKLAIQEEQALGEMFERIDIALENTGCSRAILVGHNAAFDLAVLKAASERCKIKHFPFHAFSTLDTVSLSALVYGQTVLAKAVKSAGFEWDSQQAHSAKYDATKTAELFCHIVNQWKTVPKTL